MECTETFDTLKDKSVYQLLTRLCEKVIENRDESNNLTKVNRRLTKKLRSRAYEILLRKSELNISRESPEPVIDLLSYYFVKNSNKKNISDYNNLAILRKEIDLIFDEDYETKEPYFSEVLTCVVLLKDTAQDDPEKFEFENPFSFGKLDNMLFSEESENNNDPKPYQHFPSEIFQMPFTISDDMEQNNKFTLYPYLLDSFISKPGSKVTNFCKIENSNSLSSLNYYKRDQLSLLSYENSSSKSDEGFPEISRLTGPRYLNIPEEEHTQKNIRRQSNFNINSNVECDEAISQINTESGPAATLWELASMEVNILPDLWEEASKLPPVEKRGFISSSSKQMYQWKQIHLNRTEKLNIISEAQFILHVKHLILGIESSSFFLDKRLKKFAMKPRLCLEGLLQITLKSYISDLLKIGTCYWRLNNLVQHKMAHIEIVQPGVVYKVMCDIIEHYLVWFCLEIDKIFGEGLVTIEHEGKRLPTLMEINNSLKSLSIQIQTLARICNINEIEMNENYMHGAGLMAYLYDEISMITKMSACKIMYAMLEATCNIYFRFIQRFIFEGELEDYLDEFFIKKDPQNIESYNKRYWNKGFFIRNNKSVPEFLQGIAKHILLCGKSLRLLKLCNPDDPLCVMLSSDYPPIKCCLTFEEIQNQQLMYEQYRTQCLYVCGEPITFQRLLMQKDAEQRTFREMVALKQAETMEKIIDERKRLVHILQTNKRKQFAALRKEAEDAIARRDFERERNIKEEKLLLENLKAGDALKKIKMEEEKIKVKAFYDEIEGVVAKRQLIAEWKIKRLRLDVRRVELLTSEKINLNREQLELEHKQLTESDIYYERYPSATIDTNEILKLSPSFDDQFNNNEQASFDDDINKINKLTDIINQNITSELETDVNVLSNMSKSDIANSNVLPSKDLPIDNVNDAYKQQKLEALRNKRKVLSHEFQMDSEDCNHNMLESDENSHMLSALNNNISDAMKNRDKILGSNINKELIVDKFDKEMPQFDTEASREALRNKQKVLGHEYGIDVRTYHVKARDSLTLDLKKCNSNWNKNHQTAVVKNKIQDFTPESSTPGDINIRLDLETPSTFDIGPFGLPSATCSSPKSKSTEETSNITNKITTKGFHFPNVIEEDLSSDVPDKEKKDDTPETLKDDTELYNIKSTIWNFSNDDLNFEHFRPFGIKSTADVDFTTPDVFEKPFVLNDDRSPYPDVTKIIREAEKKPLTDVFKMIRSSDINEDILNRIGDIDFNTMAICLQRSVSIPLSYQMEMVNNATLKYFLVDCDLYDHLRNIRDYFFLMDGEFAKTICSNLFEKLSTVESPKELLNFATLHSILDKSFGSSVCGLNKYADNLSFIVNDLPISFHHSSPDVLECLTLTYNVKWPLNIIFSPEAMDRYAKVFQFLIKMRRISWTLEHDSEVLKMSLKEEFMVSKDLLYSPQYHSIQLYRHTMSSLIRALHSYIATTCLQLSWTEFEKDLLDARTLDDLYTIHVVYVKKVLFRCLLNNRSATIMILLNDIFAVCLRFHHLLNARCWHIAENEVHYTHPLFSQMRELFVTFEKFAKHLHKVISRLTDRGYQPHLVELLTVINMNDYYSSNSCVAKV